VADGLPTVELLLTYRAAGRVLGVTERTVWTYVQRGELPAVRFGGSVRIDPADLRVFINKAKQTDESGSTADSKADAGGGR